MKFGPYTVDVKKIAKGVFDLFDESEKEILRFGMLPAKKMDLFEKGLDGKLREGLDIQPHHKQDTAAWWPEGKPVITLFGKPVMPLEALESSVEFDIPSVKRDISKAVVLEIYALGNLVV